MPALRRALDIAALALIGGILLETWFVGGLFSAYTISGGSMGPTLLGPHHELKCPQCGESWIVNWDGIDNVPFFTCPNCGTAARRDASRVSPLISGDRVFLDRSGLEAGEAFERWDLAAFRHPENTREFVVKRIVGLPGEKVELRDGDVYINGKMARKSLGQFLAMAVPAFGWNSVSAATSSTTWGWLPLDEPTGWALRSGGLLHEARANPANRDTLDWIGFGSVDTREPARIVDLLGYNAGRSRRDESINEVSDFGVTFLLKKPCGDGELRVQIRSRGQCYELVIEWPSKRVRLLHGGDEIGRKVLPPLEDPSIPVMFATFDGRVAAAVGDRQLFDYVPENGVSENIEGDAPLQIGVTSVTCQLENIHVFRDIYYTKPFFSRTHWGCERPIILGENSYYCLGDNSCVSEDSRTWNSGPELPASLIVGRPVMILRFVSPGRCGRLFPVPKQPTIHYIH